MKPIGASKRDEIAAAIRGQAREGELTCAQAFHIAGELGVRPIELGIVADDVDARFVRCQLGLFGYGPSKSIVEPADEVPPDLAQFLRDGMILGHVPCAVAWAAATHFGLRKLDVSNAAEKLGIRIAQCQLGSF